MQIIYLEHNKALATFDRSNKELVIPYGPAQINYHHTDLEELLSLSSRTFSVSVHFPETLIASQDALYFFYRLVAADLEDLIVLEDIMLKELLVEYFQYVKKMNDFLSNTVDPKEFITDSFRDKYIQPIQAVLLN